MLFFRLRFSPTLPNNISPVARELFPFNFVFLLFVPLLLTDIKWPASLKDIERVEKLNNLSVNVFGYEDESLHPLYLSETNGTSTINLLLITKEEDGRTKFHNFFLSFEPLKGIVSVHVQKKNGVSSLQTALKTNK